MEEHAGKLWFGICAGRTVPSARLALAGTRITALDNWTTRNTAGECKYFCDAGWGDAGNAIAHLEEELAG